MTSGVVDLTTCDAEPIHIPGLVQPHGALLAFDQERRLIARSLNAPGLLGIVPDAGARPSDVQLTPALDHAIGDGLAEPDNDGEPRELLLAGRTFDVISHRAGERSILEFEPRPPDAPRLELFAIEAQRALGRLHRARSVADLLRDGTEEVRRMTGFDRVMCYRFRHDQSGEVVVEQRRPDLEPFLGLRYPASDIPAQARRLYLLNPLRFIADVDAAPVPLDPPMGPESAAPLDLSHAVLRSVSPIHIEYLRNMGVSASMSISIVVHGQLWGLFACHHYSGTKWVPQAVRVACRLLAQIVSVLLERLEGEEHRAAVARTDAVRKELVTTARDDDDLLWSLGRSTAVREVIASHGVAIALDRRLECLGQTPPRDTVVRLIERLRDGPGPDLVATHHLRESLPDVGPLGGTAGMLAIGFHRAQGGWLLWFRGEEVETIRWAGNPDKVYAEGPNGPRLSPRGSFAEYCEQVREQALPWSTAEIEVASLLRGELQDVALARASELERARELLVATLSHDLRTPLNAIGLSAAVLARDTGQSQAISSRISASTHRMRRLVDQMLDYSRIQAGVGLAVQPRDVDVAGLVRQIIDETVTAYPGFEVLADVTGGPRAWVDPDRFSQTLSNLLSNARHHGALGKPASVVVRGGGTAPLLVRVVNEGADIPPQVRATLFKPFKLESMETANNRRGLGLGLYIVDHIVRGHGGAVTVDSAGGIITFTVTFPPPAA